MSLSPDSPLTPADLERMQDRFERALDLPVGEREAFLEELAREDAALATRVRRLLEAHARTGRELVSPISNEVVRALGAPDDRWVGARIGAYQVVRLIGVGGMGTVYEAVRADDQYHHRVAIKFLRHHAAGEPTLTRFRHERQILANLHHPNIAALLDGGVTPDGQPYFVMEFIEGEPITRWADARSLPVRDRLRLFLQVCAAVQNAHQSLVVHRDLKPGNILVTGDGTVKLLDFGIARLLREEEGGEDLPPTQTGFRAYTPDYASPEQVLGLPAGTRSDGYAMGVVLFELLAGRRPFEFHGKSTGEVERLVGQVLPPRPSTVLSPGRETALAERSAARARDRLAGDLDAIVLQALRKEPERRYGSAEEFAADIRRHLDGRPVVARPDGVGYRLGKLVRRHRAAAAAIVLALASLVGGTVVSIRQARAAERERDRAAEVTSFLTTMLGAANPAAFGREVQVREVLDSASVRAETLGNRPELQAEIRGIIGGTYLALGEFERAETEYRRSLAEYQAVEPRGGGRQTAYALNRLSTALEFQGRYAEADSLLRQATGLFERFAPEELATAGYVDLRGRILVRLGRMAEAVPLLRSALDIQLRSPTATDSAVAYAYTNLGMVTSELGDHVAAESLMVAGLAAARRAHGEIHPLVAAILSPLANVQASAGRFPEADATFQATIAMRRELLGPEHPDFAWSMFSYADFLVRRGRNADAAEWSRRVLELRGRSLTDAHPAVSTAMGVLGRALSGMDSLAVAERWLRESLAVRRTHFPPGHFLIASSESILGEHLIRAGRFQEAEAHLLAGERGLVEARGEEAEIVQEARQRLIKLYETWNRPAEAATWRAR